MPRRKNLSLSQYEIVSTRACSQSTCRLLREVERENCRKIAESVCEREIQVENTRWIVWPQGTGIIYVTLSIHLSLQLDLLRTIGKRRVGKAILSKLVSPAAAVQKDI